MHKMHSQAQFGRSSVDETVSAERVREEEKNAHTSKSLWFVCKRSKKADKESGWMDGDRREREKKKKKSLKRITILFSIVFFLFYRHLLATAAATLSASSEKPKQRGERREKKIKTKLRCRPLTSHECMRIESISTKYARVRLGHFVVRRKNFSRVGPSNEKVILISNELFRLICSRDVSHAFDARTHARPMSIGMPINKRFSILDENRFEEKHRVQAFVCFRPTRLFIDIIVARLGLKSRKLWCDWVEGIVVFSFHSPVNNKLTREAQQPHTIWIILCLRLINKIE